MKKNYFLVAILSFVMVSMNAQFAADDMESYGGGNAPILEGHWSSWDSTAGPALLSSNAQAQSGSLSGYVNNDPVTGVDALLLLGNKIFGEWGVKFSLYIPAGKVGYWNLQGDEAPGIQYVVGNIYMANGVANQGIGEIDMSTSDLTDDVIFSFPHDQWFDVVLNFDFNLGASASKWEMWVDGVNVIPAGTDYADGTGALATALGGIDFYAIDADNEMYIDDVEYISGFFTLATQDLEAKGFDAYKDRNNILHLSANESINNVSIYNMLGQEVYRSSTNTSSIDMNSYANGTYIVKVNVNGAEGSVKVIR